MKRNVIRLAALCLAALILYAIPVLATDSRVIVDRVVGVSDIAEICTYGRELKEPIITTTEGAPTFFNTSGNGVWQKMTDGGWVDRYDGVFDEGEWRYSVQLCISGDAAYEYRFPDENSLLFVMLDGVPLMPSGTVNMTFSSISYVTTPAITVEAQTVPALRFTLQPSDFTGAQGAYTTFSVKAEGEEVVYQWQANTGSAWKNVTSAGFDQPNLKVQLTKVRNGYRYRCVITDKNGQTVISDEARLKVAVPLAILSQPQSAEGALNTFATFSVKASGGKLSYRWQVNTGSTWKNVTCAGYNQPDLKVQLTKARNGYRYRCVITDGDGQTVTSQEVMLTVAEPFAIVSQPQSAEGALNTFATFSVKATGSKLSYRWQVNTGSTWKNVTCAGYNQPDLKVQLTKARNGYRYRCVITDGSGQQKTTDTVSLTIQ